MELYVGLVQIDTDFDEDGNPTGGAIISRESAPAFMSAPGQEDIRAQIAKASKRRAELQKQRIEEL